MSKSPAFQFYPNDFLSDPKTLVMTVEEIGAYWLLICVCWKENGLPKKIKILSQLARAEEKNFSRMWKDKISCCFYFDEATDGFRHKRLDVELAKQRLNSAKRKAAADSRWEKEQCKSNANASQLHCKTDALQCLSSSTSTSVRKEEISKEALDISEKKKGSRISVNFRPSDEMLTWARKTAPGLDLETRILEFKNYWESRTGRDATKLDWDKTFQNRILQIVEFRPTNGAKNNGQFKTAREKSNDAAIETEEFLEQFREFAEQQKPELYAEIDGNYQISDEVCPPAAIAKRRIPADGP